MNTLLKHFPEIIKESASSPLGIVALIVLLIAVLAFFFFKTAPINIRFAAFSMMAIMFFVIALIAISEKTQEFKNLHQDPPYAGPQTQPVQPQTQPPQTPQADSAENQLKRELNDRLAYAHALISSVADQVEKVTTAPPSEMDREKNSLQQVSQQFVTFFPGVWNGYVNSGLREIEHHPGPFNNDSIESILGQLSRQGQDTSSLRTAALKNMKISYNQFLNSVNSVYAFTSAIDASQASTQINQARYQQSIENLSLAIRQIEAALSSLEHLEPIASAK